VKILKILAIVGEGLLISVAVICIGMAVRASLNSPSVTDSMMNEESNSPPPAVEAKIDGIATVAGPPIMSPGNIVSIAVRRDRDHVPLNPILCIKCRASLYVPGIGEKVSLEWITFSQNPGAAPIYLLTATEYSPGHHP